MNDHDRLLLEVRSWLQDEDVVLPDAEQASRQVAAALPQTRQLRRHWWPLPILGRRSGPPSAGQITDFQPAPVPATNGHMPTVIGRTQTMFSPAKAITAVALAFGVGGVLLLAQPFDQQGGSAPGAATDVVPQPPAEFSGHIVCGPPIPPDGDGSETTVDVGDEGLVLTRYRGGTWRQTIDVTDPRLEGTIHERYESDGFAVPGGEVGPMVGASTWRIENDEGAWQGGQTVLTLSDGTLLPSLTTLSGEGAYEGLTALMSVVGFEVGCTADIQGVIVEGVPAPEPYNPE